jgi:acetyltransferase-like isoleucine patch superfamily enzyme
VKKTPLLYLNSAACTVKFRLHGADASLVACEGRLPILAGSGTIRVGKRFVIRGRVAPCELSADEHGQLLIGDRVFVNHGVVIAARESIEIGDDCLIGDFSAIYDCNWHQLDPGHPDKPRPVLPGSTIGDHTVVAARSVVRGTLPPRVLAAGNPAVVVRQLEIPDGWRRGL